MVFAVCYLIPIDEATIEEYEDEENHTFAIPLFSPLLPPQGSHWRCARAPTYKRAAAVAAAGD